MTTTTTKANNNTAAIIFAVFAVACVVAFLSFRGSDVGQLPNLVGNLGGGPWLGNGVLDHIFEGLKGLGLGGVWVIVGFLAMSVLKRIADLQISERLDSVMCFAIGAAILSIIWFFLGIAGLYSTTTAVIVTLIFFALWFLASWMVKKTDDDNDDSILSIFTTKSVKDRPKNTLLDKILICLIGFQIALSLIASLAPSTAKDTLLYHFAVPKAFVAQSSNAFIDGNIASYLSLGTEMQVVWARLISSSHAPDIASGAVMWLFFPLLLWAVFLWSQEIGVSRTWSLAATAIVATIPTAYHVASSGYIDLSLALYVTLATYALTRWWNAPSWNWAILIGIFLGAALSVKLTSVFVIAAFALIVLLRARANAAARLPGSMATALTGTGKIVATGFGALLLAGAIASPWYIRTWVKTGSPVFPFYMSVWPGKANGWDVERSNLFQAMNSQYGGADVDKTNYLTAPVRVSIGAQPEQPANYDGVLGVVFLIGLPLTVWAWWKFDLPIEVKIGVGVAAIVYLFWLFSSQQLRYLLPIAPVLAIAITESAERIGDRFAAVKKVAALSLLAAAVCGLLTSFAWFCQKAPLRVVLGGETRDEYLARNLDYYPYYQEINTNAPTDAKVWLINMRRDTYNIERSVVSDYLFEDWTLRKMLWESRNAQELKAKAASLGVQYILTRHDFLFDYDRSTLVDDKKPRAENEAKLKMAKELILDPARTVKADDKFSLVKVF